jgi:hypothetical protein
MRSALTTRGYELGHRVRRRLADCRAGGKELQTSVAGPATAIGPCRRGRSHCSARIGDVELGRISRARVEAGLDERRREPTSARGEVPQERATHAVYPLEGTDTLRPDRGDEGAWTA